ncbi:MAG: non-canonical purine NTP diphosphatase [Chloroflexota bacterium]|nr:non-canonical purine NTP diphosphatase [Lentimicrobium sp.]
MKSLIFATNNKHKIEEVNHILHEKYHIVSLHETGFTDDIPETATTLEGNASLKAWHIYNLYNTDCFADDTGLEVEALNGEPGVYSARYAGEGHNFSLNVDKLLKNLEGISNRRAQFRTVVSLILNGEEVLFEGKIKGTIISERKGVNGFGYDPVFVPEGYTITMAEMPAEVKNKISHRALAMQQMADYLEQVKD